MIDISIRDVNFYYEINHIVIDKLSVDLRIDESHGKVIAVMGESGAGKTTLLNLVNRSIVPTSGELVITPTTSLLSYLPQKEVLFDHLSISENINLFQRIKKYQLHFDNAKVQHLIHQLGLRTIVNSGVPVSKLSGGEKQRVCLIRAMSINPNIMLLDEPTVALDAEVKREFLIELREIAIASNCLVLFVTHDFEDAFLVADEILYLSYGGKSGSYTHQKVKNFCLNPPSSMASLGINYPSVAIFEISNFSSDSFFLRSDSRMKLKISFMPDALIESKETNSIRLSRSTSNELYDIFRSPGGKPVVIKKGVHSFGENVNVVINGEISIYHNDIFVKSEIVKNGYFIEK